MGSLEEHCSLGPYSHRDRRTLLGFRAIRRQCLARQFPVSQSQAPWTATLQTTQRYQQGPLLLLSGDRTRAFWRQKRAIPSFYKWGDSKTKEVEWILMGLINGKTSSPTHVSWLLTTCSPPPLRWWWGSEEQFLRQLLSSTTVKGHAPLPASGVDHSAIHHQTVAKENLYSVYELFTKTYQGLGTELGTRVHSPLVMFTTQEMFITSSY